MYYFLINENDIKRRSYKKEKFPLCYETDFDENNIFYFKYENYKLFCVCVIHKQQ